MDYTFTYPLKIVLQKRHIVMLANIMSRKCLWWDHGIRGRIHDELASQGLIRGGGDTPAEITRMGKWVLAHKECERAFKQPN